MHWDRTSLVGFIALMLVAQVHCHGYMSVRFIQYTNRVGTGDNGHCCDGKWGVCQTNGCDHVFTFCLNDVIIDDDGMESEDNCNLFLRQSEEIDNQNTNVFGDNIAGINNPLVFEFDTNPEELQIKVLIYDEDGMTEDEFVDYIRADIRDLDDTWSPDGQDFTLPSRTELTVNIHQWCADDFYGPGCLTHCEGAAHGQHYYCEEETGEKICYAGWFGDTCELEYCEFVDCLNGGQCRYENDAAVCYCPEGYSGWLCERTFCDEMCAPGVCFVNHEGTDNLTVSQTDSQTDMQTDQQGRDIEAYVCSCPEGYEAVSNETAGEWCEWTGSSDELTSLPTTTTLAPDQSTTLTTTPETTPPSTVPPTDAPVWWVERSNADCDTLASQGHRYQDGVYTLHPAQSQPFTAYCDMTARGWTVIQRRNSGDLDFTRTWEEYKWGFGDLGPVSNMWLGLEKLFYLTNQRRYKLLITIRVADGTFRYAEYNHFYIDGEAHGYAIHVSGYSGNAGDALNHQGVDQAQNGSKFSTPDRDNDNLDNIDCAESLHSGWWFNGCGASNLNGPYVESTNGWPRCRRGRRCILWSTVEQPFQGDYSLLGTEMKILPDLDYEPYYPDEDFYYTWEDWEQGAWRAQEPAVWEQEQAAWQPEQQAAWEPFAWEPQPYQHHHH